MSVYRVERLLIDPKTGAAIRMNKIGDGYDTLAQARKAARDYGDLWLITDYRGTHRRGLARGRRG